MIEIKKTALSEVAECFGYKIAPDTVIMAATEKDEIMGAGEIILKDGYAILADIKMNDGYKMFNLEFAIGKSLLNMLDLRGIRYVVSNMTYERLMKALRFTEDKKTKPDFATDYKYFLCLDGYFSAHCEE